MRRYFVTKLIASTSNIRRVVFGKRMLRSIKGKKLVQYPSPVKQQTPSIVRPILQNYHLYEESEEDKEYIQVLDKDNLRRMQFEKGEHGRWTKKVVPPHAARAVDVPSDSDAILDPSQASVMRELQQMKEMLEIMISQLLKFQATVAEIHASAVQPPSPPGNSSV